MLGTIVAALFLGVVLLSFVVMPRQAGVRGFYDGHLGFGRWC